MNNIFKSITIKRPKMSKFNLSHERKLTCNMGDLVPISCEEVMPGDKFRGSTEVFMRLMPILTPVMHMIDVKVYHFYVPNRLVYDGWEKFITGGRTGEQTEYVTPPLLDVYNMADLTGTTEMQEGKLWDYLGLPPMEGFGADLEGERINMLPFFAYQKIWNDYFRDPNLDNDIFNIAEGGTGAYESIPTNVPLLNAATAGTYFQSLTSLRKKCWEHDYFTSALPWTQRGGDVDIPMDGTGSVTYKPVSDVRQDDGSFLAGNLSSYTPGIPGTETELLINAAFPGRIENIDEVILDASGVTINDLRTSIRLQEWLEKNARAGYRYIEQIFSHFGVRSSDARLQRPEYLGGGKLPVKISEVVSTYGQEDEAITQPGDMYGHGIAFGKTAHYKRRFEEHGHVMTLMCVMPRSGYGQGIPKMFSRQDKFDYPWPEFAHLGEQAVDNREIYTDWTDTELNGEPFGYQPRYTEFRNRMNSVHGQFRSTLDYWHMIRKFNTLPVLNRSFVHADPTTRIFSNDFENDDKLIVTVLNKLDALRPLPYSGTPTL